jgi:hypothetical protein
MLRANTERRDDSASGPDCRGVRIVLLTAEVDQNVLQHIWCIVRDRRTGSDWAVKPYSHIEPPDPQPSLGICRHLYPAAETRRAEFIAHEPKHLAELRREEQRVDPL